MRGVRRVFLSGCIGLGNTGDEAYGQLLAHWLAEIDPAIRLTVNTHDEQRTRDLLGVDTVCAYDLRAVTDAIAETDLVVLGGGGLFQDHESADPAALVQFPTQGYLGYAQIPLLAQACGRPVVIWANGVGPLTSDSARNLTRIAFQTAGHVSVRDAESAALLEALGVVGKPIVAPDPIFCLPVASVDAGPPLREIADVPDGLRILGVAVRPWPHQDGWQEPLAHALARIADEGVAVVFFALHGPPHGGDHLVAQQMAEMAGLGGRASVVHHERPDRIARWISQCDAFLAMRYHGLLLAARAHLPVASLAYDPKIRHLARQLPIPQSHTLELDADTAVITRTIQAVLRSRLEPNQRETVDALVAAAQEHKDVLRAALDPASTAPHPRSSPANAALEQAVTREEEARQEAREALTQLAGRDATLHALATRIREHDRQSTAILDEERRSLGWRLLRLIRRVRHQLLFGSRRERRRFARWFVRRIQGHLGEDGWRFELTLPPLAGVTDGLDLPVPATPTGTSLPTVESVQDAMAATVADFVRDRATVVILPVIEWNHPLHQRPHQLAKAYAALGFRTVYLSPAVQHDRHGVRHLADNLVLVGSLEPERYADALGPAGSLVVTTNLATNEPLIEQCPPARLVYEYIDELEIFDGYGPAFVRAHDRLVRRADLVVCTARQLHDAIKDTTDRAVYLPNAGDYDHFRAAIGQPIPDDVAALRDGYSAVIGFYGALAKWLDYDLIGAVADARPDWLYLLVGPDYDRSLGRSGILDRPNITWLGPRPYAVLPAYLQAFDVATIPFRIDRVTHSVSPVKLFEYMAGGKPIVATAVKECMQYASVLTAETPEAFVAALDDALDRRSDSDYIARLEEEAHENSWAARVRQITKLIGVSPIRLDRTEGITAPARADDVSVRADRTAPRTIPAPTRN